MTGSCSYLINIAQTIYHPVSHNPIQFDKGEVKPRDATPTRPFSSPVCSVTGQAIFGEGSVGR